jgi:hypothetical protein
MWHRRAFLSAAGATFAASLLPRRVEALERSELIFASAIQDTSGAFGAALVTERGELVARVGLPQRGHDICFSPVNGTAVAFARRPGTIAVAFDPAGKREPVTITSVEGRHFYGHGAFSPDGRLLYATENDFDQSRGVIGIYDATAGYRRIGEFDTYGVGPHEMLPMPDGNTFAIANGGIETHPDYGRAELNIETMQPSLAFVDARDGKLIGLLQLEAGLHQLSIRHMAVDAANRVWFGCQFRGDNRERPQLVGYATLDGEIRLIDLTHDALSGLRNYVGGVSVSQDGQRIGISAPTGNTILVLDARAQAVLAFETLRSGSGMAPDGDGFLVSSGFGTLKGVAGSPAPEHDFDFGFDNHLRRLPQSL